MQRKLRSTQKVRGYAFCLNSPGMPVVLVMANDCVEDPALAGRIRNLRNRDNYVSGEFVQTRSLGWSPASCFRGWSPRQCPGFYGPLIRQPEGGIDFPRASYF